MESLLLSPRYRGNFTALVGGSCIHNSTSFMREMADLESYKLSNREQREQPEQTHSSQPYRPQYTAAAPAQPARAPAAAASSSASSSAAQPYMEDYDDGSSPVAAPPRYNGPSAPAASRPAAGAGGYARPMQPGAAMRGPAPGAGQPGGARPTGPGRPIPRSSSGSLGLGE